jgi:hypothetical protein
MPMEYTAMASADNQYNNYANPLLLEKKEISLEIPALNLPSENGYINDICPVF